MTICRREFLLALAAGQSALARERVPWNLSALYRTPRHHPSPEFHEDGVTATFIEALPWRGKPTRCFAWYGMPPGRRLPGMVLVHGGGGTAYAEWVRMWNRRGFAAIAMDTCGDVPQPRGAAHPLAVPHRRHDLGGPKGWGGFDSIDEPPEDQWTYHAVADVLLAHSLLRSFPAVDSKRIGLTGISWGGYLTSIAGSLDRRFRFAAPVYGCGFASAEGSPWAPVLAKLGPDRGRRWLDLWDASRYLPRARIPYLWVSGTNDFAYPMPSLQRSYRLARGPRTLSIRPGMKHSHPDGARPEEIFAYASGTLPRLTGAGTDGKEAWVRFFPRAGIASARLEFTRDGGPWVDRKWESMPARIDARRGEARCELPRASAWFFNLADARGNIVSSEHAVE